MSYKNRWTQPTEGVPREEYYALRQELKKRALTKSRRTEIETRLDELALNPNFKGTLQEKSILSGVRPAKPTTADNLALCARVHAARKSSEGQMLLSAADIDAVKKMDWGSAKSAWYSIIQRQWPEKGFEYIMQRGWLVGWRLAVLEDKSSEQSADYFKRHQDEFVAHCAFMERYKVASPTEQAALFAEKFGLMK